MLHILLTILSTIGIILLVILGIVVVLILCLLFTPICYRGAVRKQADGISGQAGISWLCRLVYVRVSYAGEKVSYEIYILGIPVMKLRDYLRRRKAAKAGKAAAAGYTGAKKKPTRPPGQRSGNPEAEEQRRAEEQRLAAERRLREEERQREERLRSEKELGPQHGQESTDLLWEKAERLIGKIIRVIAKVIGKIVQALRFLRSLPGKIWEGLKKICFTIRRICGKIKEWYGFLTSRTFKEAFRVIKTEGLVILKHIRPKKITGYVKFGFDDPALTGQVLGVAGMFYPVLPKKLAVIPDFEEARLEADVKVKGRIFLIVLIVHGLKIYRDKYVNRVIKKFQHKEA